MDFAQLLAGHHEPDDTPKLTDDQIVTRLEEYFARIHGEEPERFTPGQIIYAKCPGKTRFSKQPHIFIRYLDEPIVIAETLLTPENVTSNLAPQVFDAVYATVPGDGATHEWLCCTRDITAEKPEQ